MLNISKKNIVLLRQESFGSTGLMRNPGIRFYLNKDETTLLIEKGLFPTDMQNKESFDYHLIYTEPKLLQNANFSAPDTVFFEVTRACNLRCTHCFNDSGIKMGDELTHSERMEVVADLVKTGVQEIRFTGGEPLALPGIYDLIELASSEGLRVSIGSNGVLIDKKVSAKLSRLGVNRVIVSLDGLKNEHDLIRGVGTYKKTLNALTALKEVGISTRINCVVMKSNLESIKILISELLPQGHSLMIRRLIPSGRASEDWAEMLNQSDYRKLENDLRDQVLKFGNLEGHYLFDKPTVTRIPLPFERRNCSAGHRGMVVMPNGLVQTCGFLGPLGEGALGKLPKEKMADIWERLNQSSHIATYQEMTADYNKNTPYPQTNCLAMGLASNNSSFVQIGRR